MATTELDGLPTERSEAPPPSPGRHPNGTERVDHVVVFSPDLDRTVAALEAAGLPLRRIRDEPTPAGAPRQAFFRLGEAILEVIQEPADTVARKGEDRPARLWGLAFLVDDLATCAVALGDHLGPPRDAVQPGRQIATLHRSANLSIPIAFMTPEPQKPALQKP